jgi:acyl-CoA synthetase (AMP-forming)/AMP-acid ligase II/aryl carrier-like protein
MPLTHDMGLIGFFIMQFNKHVHINLMPTESFVRRPLLWMQLASKKRATITCSPNFGYRHFLKVLGDRTLGDLDLSSIRSIYNGAEPISVPLCNEFMRALEGYGLKRQAMFPVYGMAEASLAVSFPRPGIQYRWIRVNRHKLTVGAAIEINPADGRDALELMSVGSAVPSIEIRITDAARAPLGDGHVGHILIRGPSVTQGYFGDAEATALAIDAAGWLDTGDLGVIHEGSLYIAGRSKEIIFINGMNYYPYDLENIAQRAPGLDLNKVVVTGVSRLEVAQVSPVTRIPKTTSGKVQRHLLQAAHVAGEFDVELAELEALRAADAGRAGAVTGSDLESRLQAICENALPGKRVDVNDNLFEIGASSLKLIEIHESIDREFPGLIDLTELFDHPTLAELARHIEGKLARSDT